MSKQSIIDSLLDEKITERSIQRNLIFAVGKTIVPLIKSGALKPKDRKAVVKIRKLISKQAGPGSPGNLDEEPFIKARKSIELLKELSPPEVWDEQTQSVALDSSLTDRKKIIVSGSENNRDAAKHRRLVSLSAARNLMLFPLAKSHLNRNPPEKLITKGVPNDKFL